MMRALRIGRTAAVLAIGLGVLVGAPLPGQAQIRDRLGEQLQTTDDVLDRARLAGLTRVSLATEPPKESS